MTFDDVAYTGKPFYHSNMAQTGRFLMFIFGSILYFDLDGTCGNWADTYHLNLLNIEKEDENYHEGWEYI